MLERFEAEGMRPAQQARSRALVIRLFNEGLTLLREVDFDGLSVDALCARADSTIGAFYSRFESKEAFINALQRVVVAVTRKVIVHGYEADGAPRDNLEHLVAWIAKGATPTDRVARLLESVGVGQRAARSNPEKAKPKKKAQERAAAAAAAAEKAAAEAAAE